MNEFTKEKLAFVIGLSAILFTLSSLLETLGKYGFSLFGFTLTISHLYYFIAAALLISVYFYGIRFITDRYIHITESIGDYLYIIVILAPPIYIALFLVVLLSNLLGMLFKSDIARSVFEIVFTISIGILSSFISEKLRRLFIKKDKISSIQQLQTKEAIFFNRAESLFNSGNYDLSVVECFKSIEIAAQKYLLDHGHISNWKTNFNWIKYFEEKKLVFHEYIDKIQYIKKQRNMAVHGVKPIYAEIAKDVLNITSKILATMTSIYSCPDCGSLSVAVNIESDGDFEMQELMCNDCGWTESTL